MAILFYDTETTGLPDRRLPLNHPKQPHLVQLACLLTDDDGTERASLSIVVNPGVLIPPEVSAIHGITDAIADQFGVASNTAVAMFDRLAERASLIVAHNIRFDWALMETAWARLPKPRSLEEAHGARRRVCTMEEACPVVNLPPTERMRAAGMNRPKSPKLEECIQHFFGERLDGAHDALVDVRACARVFFHLRTLRDGASAQRQLRREGADA